MKTLILTLFVVQGCGAKNNAPFHVYRSALEETGKQQNDTGQEVLPTSDVRIASIGLKHQK